MRLELPAEVVDELVDRVAVRVLEQLGESASASEYLTVAEAAELLRAKPQRVYDLLSARRLTRYRDGSRVLVARSELLAYLAGGVAPALPRGSRSRVGAGGSV